jgi:1-acyl-sn-glycerol-3-phosphate acyltransferase
MAAAARTLFAGFLTGIAVLLGLPFLLLWTWITGKPDFMYRVSMKFCRFALRLLGIRVRVEGIENIPPSACVFAANHTSNLDGVVLLPAIPRRISLFAKRELFRIPIFAAGMRSAGFIPVDRVGRQATSGLATAVRHLKEGRSLSIFPEGTRSPDGRLQPFKKGAFALAIESGLPVVPVSIAGTHRLLRRGDWVIHPGEATLHFGPAVDASPYAMKQRAELLARVESLVAAALPPDQKPSDPPTPRAGTP